MMIEKRDSLSPFIPVHLRFFLSVFSEPGHAPLSAVTRLVR